MKKILCKIFWLSFILLFILSSHSFAMPRNEFDQGMKKGIEYFDNQMYYEAKDEFQWFCDYNWGQMSPGQQKYALDYLGGTKQAIFNMEYDYVPHNKYFQKYKNFLLKYGEYDGVLNCYEYMVSYGDYGNIFFYYNIGLNTAIVTCGINEESGIYTASLSLTEENTYNTYSVIYYYDDFDIGQMYCEFYPYSYGWNVTTSNYNGDITGATNYYLNLINEQLYLASGLTLYDLGVYY